MINLQDLRFQVMKGKKTKQSAVRKLHLLISIFIVLLRVN